MYSHWGVWSFARILHVVHRTCSQWWRKVAAELFRSIFGLRTLNQRVFQPLNKRQDQRSNSLGRFFPSFLVPSPRQTKQSKNQSNSDEMHWELICTFWTTKGQNWFELSTFCGRRAKRGDSTFVWITPRRPQRTAPFLDFRGGRPCLDIVWIFVPKLDLLN